MFFQKWGLGYSLCVLYGWPWLLVLVPCTIEPDDRQFSLFLQAVAPPKKQQLYANLSSHHEASSYAFLTLTRQWSRISLCTGEIMLAFFVLGWLGMAEHFNLDTLGYGGKIFLKEMMVQLDALWIMIVSLLWMGVEFRQTELDFKLITEAKCSAVEGCEAFSVNSLAVSYV